MNPVQAPLSPSSSEKGANSAAGLCDSTSTETSTSSKVVEVARPVPGPGQALVKVMAGGINPGEANIRNGLLHAMWPATFPSGQGSDLAASSRAGTRRHPVHRR